METNRTPSKEEILKAATWLDKQNYQTEQGEQEYKMYFDVDIPKMLASYSDLQNKEYKDMCAELADMLRDTTYGAMYSEKFDRAEKVLTKYNHLINK